MTILFDDATFAGGTLFADLDSGVGTVYSQSGDASVAFYSQAGQTGSWVYEQVLDVELVLTADAYQELVLPSAPVAYLQTGNVQIITYVNAGHEHIPAFAGIWGQTGNAQIAWQPTSFHFHDQGYDEGDIFQVGFVELRFQPASLQIWDPSAIDSIGYGTVDLVAAYASTPSDVTVILQAPLPTISQIDLTFDSANQYWQIGAGPNGEAMGVQVSVEHEGTWTKLVSLTTEYPTATFYKGQGYDDSLLIAMADGSALFRLEAFEALPSVTIPHELTGTGLLTVRAVQ